MSFHTASTQSGRTKSGNITFQFAPCAADSSSMRKVLLGIAAFVIVALVALFKINSGPELSVRISAPNSILVGETFALVLHLSNPHSEPVTLDSVEIDNAVFATFEVISVTPEPSKPSQSFGPESFGWEYWTFQRVFEPATTEQSNSNSAPIWWAAMRLSCVSVISTDNAPRRTSRFWSHRPPSDRPPRRNSFERF